jgi:hypothetical protein
MLTAAQLCGQTLDAPQLRELEIQGRLLDAGPRLAARWAALAADDPELVGGRAVDLDDPASGALAYTLAGDQAWVAEVELADRERQLLVAAREVVSAHCGFRHIGQNLRHLSWQPGAWALNELMAVDPQPIRLLEHDLPIVLIAPETLRWLRDDPEELAVQLLHYELQAKLAIRLGHRSRGGSLGVLLRDAFLHLVGLAVRDWQLHDGWPSGEQLIRDADEALLTWLIRHASYDTSLTLSLRPLLRLVESGLDASDRALAARLDSTNDRRTTSEWRDFFTPPRTVLAL